MDNFAHTLDRLIAALRELYEPGRDAPEDYPELLTEWREAIAWYGKQAALRTGDGPRPGDVDVAPIFERIARGSMTTALRQLRRSTSYTL